MPTLTQVKKSILDLLFPPKCIGCGTEGGFLCPPCSESLPRLNPPYCIRCGLPINAGILCSRCSRSSLSIDCIRSPFLYQGLAREAIQQLKYKRLKALAEPLAGLLADYLHANQLSVDVLVAVPLHSRRLRERGYNQSALLAIELGQLAGLPVIEGSLIRLRNTAPQVRITAADPRRDNVRGAFGCKGRDFSQKQVLLIDDVCTTGATLDACALALKEAGAASVLGLTLAREV